MAILITAFSSYENRIKDTIFSNNVCSLLKTLITNGWSSYNSIYCSLFVCVKKSTTKLLIASDYEDQETLDIFNKTFGHYMTGGDLNNINLYTNEI